MTTLISAPTEDSCRPGHAGRVGDLLRWPGVRFSAWSWGVLLAIQVLSAPVALAAVVTTNQSRPLSITCEFEPPQFTPVGDSTRVNIAGCDNWERVGEPSLPFRTVRVLLPPAADISQIEVQAELAPRPLPGERRVDFGRTPARPGNLDHSAPSQVATEQPNPAIYGSDAPFPAAQADVASIQRMGGYDIAFVRVYPVQYAPLSGKLTFAPRLRVTLSLSTAKNLTTPTVRAPGVDRARQDVAAMVENPEMLNAYNTGALLSPFSPAIYDYLLITKSSLAAAFQPLVNRKTAAGLSVKVETMESIITTQSGRDQPEKLRNYIRFAFTNWGITYVLLGGDTSVVPTRYAYAYMSTLESGRFPRHLPACDLYYACLDGSWERDGDNTFGEPTDGESGGEVDLLAEVYVGRAPVDTVAEVNTFVEKTVRYETQAHGRLTNALFIAEYLGTAGGFVAQGWDMFVPLTNYFAGYAHARLDDSPYTTPQWSYLDAIAALNQSPHLALFAGHGDPSTVMGLIADDLDTLTNPWPSLVYSVSCDSGAYDNDSFFDPFDCVGEELVKRNARAAFAAVLNSREGWYDAQTEWKWSGEFQIKFFEELLKKGNTRLGVANQLSKHALISKVETGGLMTYRFCYFEITLLGDPHVALQVPAAAAQLIVASAHGGASPPVGQNKYVPGTPLICAMTNSPVSGGVGTQFVCTGWTGAGSIPTSGSTNQVNVTLMADSHITWNWKTQVWITATVSGSGAVNVASGWRDTGIVLPIQAVASNYHHFVQWTGDVPAAQQSNATISLTLAQPCTVAAEFAPNLTSNGTPESWLAGYGWTNQLEAASVADTDQDGMPAWAEYVAGTSPVDATSKLSMSVASVGGAGPVLHWPSVAGRTYAVYHADSVNGPFTLLTNGVPATPPLNSFSPLAVGPAQFYRVGVSHAP